MECEEMQECLAFVEFVKQATFYNLGELSVRSEGPVSGQWLVGVVSVRRFFCNGGCGCPQGDFYIIFDDRAAFGWVTVEKEARGRCWADWSVVRHTRSRADRHREKCTIKSDEERMDWVELYVVTGREPSERWCEGIGRSGLWSTCTAVWDYYQTDERSPMMMWKIKKSLLCRSGLGHPLWLERDLRSEKPIHTI